METSTAMYELTEILHELPSLPISMDTAEAVVAAGMAMMADVLVVSISAFSVPFRVGKCAVWVKVRTKNLSTGMALRIPRFRKNGDLFAETKDSRLGTESEFAIIKNEP